MVLIYKLFALCSREIIYLSYIFAGLGRLSQAEEYLAQAQWTVLKTPSCSNAIKSKLYRNLGLLYAAKGEYDDSLRQLADDVSQIYLLSYFFKTQLVNHD